jgi:hypothetical protein
MIRLERIELTGFRGALEKLPLELTSTGRSVAIFGENAAGKSSLTDAIEWFYNDRVDHLWKEHCKESSLRHALLAEKASSAVAVDFSEHALDSTKTLSPSLKSTQSNKTPQFLRYLARIQAGQERVVLRNADLLSFVLSTKTEKRQYLARIIGYEALDDFRETIQLALTKIEGNADFVTARRNLPEYQKEMLTLAGTTLRNQTELFAAAQNIATNAGVTASITDDTSYTAAIDTLRGQIGQQEKAARKLKLTQMKQQLDTLDGNAKRAKSSSSVFLDEYRELMKSEEELKRVKLEGFLSLGRKVLEEGLAEHDACPFCGQHKSLEELKREVNSRLTKLRESKQKYDVTLSKKDTAVADLSTATRSAGTALVNAHVLGARTEFLTILNGYQAGVESLLAEVERNFSRYMPIELDIQSLTQALVAVVSEELNALDAQLKLLDLSQEEQKLVTAINNVENLRSAFRKFERASSTSALFENQRRTLATIKSRFATVHSATLQTALDLMSDLISKYYLIMHPNENVDEIKLRILDEGVEFEYDFHGKLSYPPLKYLSESHLNSLGIAAFLASAKLFNRYNGFFFLDDVVTSFDSNHRLRLLRLLKAEFAEWQIVLLTHEAVWFEMIKKELGPEGWLISELELSTDGSVRLKTSTKSLKESVAQKAANGSITPNDIRTLLEHLAKEICYRIEVKVAFRFNQENERRMSGELLSALRATLKKKSPETNDSPVLVRLETSNFVTSMGSHDSGPVISSGDVMVCYQDILELDKLFCCPNCKAYLSTERFVEHEGKIYCKCGQSSLSWKE